MAYIEYTYRVPGGGDTTAGSGFVIAADGHILTANHVVSPRPADAGQRITQSRIAVRLGGLSEPEFTAILVRSDPDLDLALLKIPARTQAWVAIPIGDSRRLGPSDALVGLGFPGTDLTIIPPGIITSRNTTLGGVSRPWWQTSLPLNAGNSGGPIFDGRGTVVGIAVALREAGQQIGFVIPIQYALNLAQQGGGQTASEGPCTGAIAPAITNSRQSGVRLEYSGEVVLEGAREIVADELLATRAVLRRVPTIPEQSGKAGLDGAPGGTLPGDGGSGRPGQDGGSGEAGQDGASASETVIRARTLIGQLTVDNSGQAGGNGGRGGNGGAGGPGARGSSAVSGAFDCRSGPGRGGDGGVGGAAGHGGPAGDGGNAGRIVVELDELSPGASVNLVARGGRPGRPGQPGVPGPGGAPGSQGATPGLCSLGGFVRNGTRGANGAQAANGDVAQSGQDAEVVLIIGGRELRATGELRYP